MLLYLLFFISGVAGLVYEVCWVRQFGNVFGNTVYSASLVTAVFMCGLGIGSRAAGGWADRRLERPGTVRALLRTYGGAEALIAIFGVLLACLLPRLGGLSASASSYTRGSDGWFELSFGSIAFRYILATLLIAPPTVFMGATLTLLIRTTLTNAPVTDAGMRIGALYAVNTAGAALGAYACDSLLVPRVGIFSTQIVAVGANIVAGVGALWLSRLHDASAPPIKDEAPVVEKEKEEKKDESTDSDEGASRSSGSPPSPSPQHVLITGSIALGLSGFAALGMEIIWFRLLSATLGAYRYVFGLVLAVILTGIWVGALVSGFIQRRYGKALELFIGAQVLVAVSGLGLLAIFHSTLSTAGMGAGAGATAGAVKAALVVVGPPALLMGFSFPLVNAHVQDRLGTVGRRAGSMYLANTIGGVLGSLFAGFVLTPSVGSQTSFVIFAVCAAVAPFVIVSKAPLTKQLQTVVLSAAALAIVAVAAWVALPSDHLLSRFMTLPPASKVLDMKEGPNETVTVLDADGRVLYTNGHPMSATSISAQRYMRAFAHLPLLMTDRPERALIICFGVGNTIHATSLHPSLKQIEIADLSRNVLEHAKFFRATNHDVLSDQRVAVFVNDGRQHLRQQEPDSYDLVTLEPPPLVFAGVSALYSREFYEIVKTRLKPKGYMTQWLPAYQSTPELGLAMARAFIEVFPNSALLSGMWGELILIGTKDTEPLTFDLDKIEAGLKKNPRVAADLRRVAMSELTEIVGTFLADADTLREITTNVAPITDDRPQMEYAFGGNFEAPASFFTHTKNLGRFCPKCFLGTTAGNEASTPNPDPRVSWLPVYMDALRTVYAHDRFRRNEPLLLKPNPTLDAAVERSRYVAAAFGRTVPPPQDNRQPSPSPSTSANPDANADAGVVVIAADAGGVDGGGGGGAASSASTTQARALFLEAFQFAQAGSWKEAAKAYERGLALDPNDTDARYNLAVIYASIGREDEAVAQAELVLKVEPSHAKAKKMLCALRNTHCD